jgi:hypothetical protein
MPAALEKLRSLGVVYRCFLTRREIAGAGDLSPRRMEPGEGPDGLIYTRARQNR